MYLLGKRIVQLQASLALVQTPETGAKTHPPKDEYGREPFSHPALQGLNNLSLNTKSILTDRSKVAELAHKYDMPKVLRWSPRDVGYLRCWGASFLAWLLVVADELSLAHRPGYLGHRSRPGTNHVRRHRCYLVGERRTHGQQAGAGADTGALGTQDGLLILQLPDKRLGGKMASGAFAGRYHV